MSLMAGSAFAQTADPIIMTIGGKNIIPIETSTLATTISITKNGKNKTKPIIKIIVATTAMVLNVSACLIS